MNRREIIKGLAILPLAGAAPVPSVYAGREQPPKRKGIYEKLGVRPIINGRGTITVIGGCRMLPEVEQAMQEATLDYVSIDELMDAAGQKLAELTGAEWGMVTAGATAALILATTGVVTGGDPDKLWQLPDLTGMKNEVIIPKYSWTAYESAVRGVGVKMITVETKEELEAALGPNTAMVLVLAGRRSMNGPLSVKEIASLTKPRGVPILVDAAAEGLPLPNPHLSLGADLVAYSGGKYLAGPQCAGLLIGRKDLIKAAWVTSAPHHGFGRGYKVGREEVLGMLAGVEMWMKRDHEKEIKTWTKRLEYIAGKLKKIDGLTLDIEQPKPAELSNPSPSLHVKWDTARIPMTGSEVEQLLWEGEPRIAVSGMGSFLPFPPNQRPTIMINTSQLNAGEEKIIADRVFEVLSNPKPSQKTLAAPASDLTGEWDVEMKFAAGTAHHRFSLFQKENAITGTHHGTLVPREVAGTISGNEILLRSFYKENGVRLSFEFTGTMNGANAMGGKLSLSEYGRAEWLAKRK